jgi:steroid delta-isomerase-like uncharacterized protein
MTSPNKQLLLGYIDAYNRDAMDELAGMVDNAYVHHSNGDSLSIEGFRKGTAWIKRGMPDFRVEVLDMLEEGDRVAVRFVGRGTHFVSMVGEAVTSKPIAWYGCTVFQIADGRILEDWEVMDEADLMRQIGAAAA